MSEPTLRELRVWAEQDREIDILALIGRCEAAEAQVAHYKNPAHTAEFDQLVRDTEQKDARIAELEAANVELRTGVALEEVAYCGKHVGEYRRAAVDGNCLICTIDAVRDVEATLRAEVERKGEALHDEAEKALRAMAERDELREKFENLEESYVRTVQGDDEQMDALREAVKRLTKEGAELRAEVERLKKGGIVQAKINLQDCERADALEADRDALRARLGEAEKLLERASGFIVKGTTIRSRIDAFLATAGAEAEEGAA